MARARQKNFPVLHGEESCYTDDCILHGAAGRGCALCTGEGKLEWKMALPLATASEPPARATGTARPVPHTMTG